ncbi:MAG: hypothetical protein ABIE42_04235 [Candidatus Eisenbacteria bacterium]
MAGHLEGRLVAPLAAVTARFWGASISPLALWLMIMATPAMNILLALVFHKMGPLISGEYRRKRESEWQIILHFLVVSGVTVFGVALLGTSHRSQLVIGLATAMAVASVLVLFHALLVGEAFLASRTVALKEQARGFPFDILCVAAMLYVGVRFDQPIWVLGAVLRLHHGLWSTYHLLFLNVPALSYGYVAGALLLTALFVYPLGPGTLKVETLHWFFSTIAQVFAAVLGVVGIFATFTLRRAKVLGSALLTPTTSVLEGITGFTLVNLLVIGVAGASIPYSVGAQVNVVLDSATVLAPWVAGAAVPTLLVVLNTALVLNALGYTALFLWRTYSLGWTEGSE